MWRKGRPNNLRNRPTVLLIFCISHSPGINLQIKVFNGGVQPDPIFSVFQSFQYKNYPRFLSGLYCIIRALPHRLGPIIAKIKFNRERMGSENGVKPREWGQTLIID
jgi:hypothetical protein